MRQIPAAILVGFAIAAPAVSASADADVSVEEARVEDGGAFLEADYEARADGVQVDGLVSGVAWAPFSAGRLFSFDLTAAAGAELQPAQAWLLAFLLPAAAPATATLAENEATQPVAEETEDLYDEGAAASAQGHAGDEGVEAEAEASAGSHTASHGASTPVDPSGGASRWTEPGSLADEPETAPVAEAEREPEPQAQPFLSEPDAAPAPSADEGLPAALAASVAVATASTGVAFVAAPGWRNLAWRSLRRIGAFALFSRIAQEDILSHGRRAELFEFIKQNPGERVEVARRTLGFSNGSMHYHLRVLRDRNLVRVLRERGSARLYPAGPKITPTPYVPQQRRRVLEVLSFRPGVTQREAAQLLGISERMASYHIHRLAAQGLVEIQNEGARRRLFLKCATPAPIAAS